jgi:hypothetical protein
VRLFGPILLALLITLIAACGEGTSADETYRQAAEQAVDGAVLTLSDLPEGWKPSEIGSAALAGIELGGECSLLNGRGAGFPGAVASADSEPFSGPGDQELASTITAFTDIASAELAVRLADDLVVQCTDQVEEALKEAIRRAAAESNLAQLLGDIEASVEPGSFRELGNETRAYRLRADFSALLLSFEVNGHIVVIRQGPLTGVMLYAVLGALDEESENAIATALSGNLAEAEDTLR